MRNALTSQQLARNASAVLGSINFESYVVAYKRAHWYWNRKSPDAAKLLGVSVRTLSAWETGARLASPLGRSRIDALLAMHPPTG